MFEPRHAKLARDERDRRLTVAGENFNFVTTGDFGDHGACV